MSEKTLKLVRKIGQKTFDKHAREAIFKYVDRLCREPLRVRLAYAWKFVRGLNPHTGERPSDK
jgi:4-hydroxy-L-threonine phosphate dehydrogenase PdxA